MRVWGFLKNEKWFRDSIVTIEKLRLNPLKKLLKDQTLTSISVEGLKVQLSQNSNYYKGPMSGSNKN